MEVRNGNKVPFDDEEINDLAVDNLREVVDGDNRNGLQEDEDGLHPQRLVTGGNIDDQRDEEGNASKFPYGIDSKRNAD